MGKDAASGEPIFSGCGFGQFGIDHLISTCRSWSLSLKSAQGKTKRKFSTFTPLTLR